MSLHILIFCIYGNSHQFMTSYGILFLDTDGRTLKNNDKFNTGLKINHYNSISIAKDCINQY